VHYQRMSEAATATAATPATLLQEHGGHGFMQQIGPKRPDNHVMVRIRTSAARSTPQAAPPTPPRSSTAVHLLDVAAGCEDHDQQRGTIQSRHSCSETARYWIGSLKSLPKCLERGASDTLVAALDQREARRPQTEAEFAAEFVGMKGFYANEILREIREAP